LRIFHKKGESILLSEVQGAESQPGRSGLIAGIKRLTYASPLYAYTLIGRAPARLLGTPPEPMPGDAAAGQAILSGYLSRGRHRLKLTDMTELPEASSEEWLAYLHGFSWLSDLRRVGTDAARRHSQFLISGWIAANSRWSPVSWRADVMGERLVSWLTHFGFYAAGRDEFFLGELFPEFAKQVRHLCRTAITEASGRGRIVALKGIVYCGVSLPDHDKYLHLGLRLMEDELNHQILPDGGHISRNPEQHLQALSDLVSIRETLAAAHLDCPGWLQVAIDRMAPMLRGLRHGDGGLALFNGGPTGDAEYIDAILSKANVRTRAFSNAPHSGFQRLAAGRTTLIVDTGSPPPESVNPWGHAGALSFELSVGKERLIVNCGACPDQGGEWRHALRSTAAHSAVVVDGENSSAVDPKGGYLRTPARIQSSRREIEGNSMLEVTSDAFERTTGVTHRRLIMLAPDGADIQGEDGFSATHPHIRRAGGNSSFITRFHLHPNVQATIVQGGKAVLLKPRRGKGWRFAIPQGFLELDQSVYFDGAQPMRRNMQIVVKGILENGSATLKWRLTRM
jgi:uncharacterized heparinase superfamily protein